VSDFLTEEIVMPGLSGLRAFAWAVLFFAQGAIAAAPPAEAAKTGPVSFAIEPAPAWVVPARESRDVVAERAPLSYRVIDDQFLVDAKGATAYSHLVRVVNESGGLGPASQVEIDFDPSFQTLVFHHFDVVRGGKHLNRLDRKKIQLLHRETQLERRMYDGRVTASIVVEDVRVGDEIDFAYSIRGSNPVFEGRFVNPEWMVSSRGPVALYQLRVLAPEARKIQVRLGADDMQMSSRVDGKGMRETLVRRERVAQFRGDPGTPYSAALRQMVQFSEFADWSDVARWGTTLFSPAPSSTGGALDRKAAEIRAATPDREKQLLAALRFVQTDVRYFGTEIGPNTHKPANPEKVMEQRFGDCKDKVMLLVALLRRLDIAATPVLVSTTQRGQVESFLPSPLAFDHVIARVDLAGKTWFLDATRAHQSGELANRMAVGFNRGLPLAADTTALAPLPQAYDQVRMTVQDTFTVKKFSDGAALEARITYRGDLAELIREALATRSASEVESQVAMPYARIYPKLKATAPMRVEGSESDDAVTLVLNFSIAEPWRFPEQRLLVMDVVQWALVDAIRVPNDPSRREAYWINFPGIYRHSSAVEFAEDVYPTPGSQRFDDGDARLMLHTKSELSTRRSEVAGEVDLRVDEISPAEWPAHMALVAKLAPRAGITLAAPAVTVAGMEALKKDLRDLDESVRAKNIKVTTQTQYQSLAMSAALSSQINSGRLTGTLKAQALTERGIHYDNLARFDEARKDFETAIELAPGVPESLNAAAVNALLLKNYPRVFDLAGQVLARNAGDTEARRTRALASYFAKDYAAARADLEELLKNRSQVRRGYPIVWLSLVSQQAGQDFAQDPKRFPDDQLPQEWPRPLVDWALGKASVDSVIGAAKAGTGSPQRLCEAYYYIGEKYLADGDRKRAREFFQKAVDQGVTEFIEDNSARNRLASVARSD
jgi:lipoprotein NlpI/transglutaminase-like putative cysteine protease